MTGTTDRASASAASSAAVSAIGRFELLSPAAAPSIRCSSPHALDYTSFARLFDWSPRRASLLDALRLELAHLAGEGLVSDCLLVGGSFVGRGDDPRDIDALVIYRWASQDGVDDKARTLLRRRVPGLDLRFVPADAAPALIVRMSCFFHTLYQSRDRGGAQPSFIVSLREDPS